MRPYFTGENVFLKLIISASVYFSLTNIWFLQLWACVVYFNDIEKKKYHFPPQFFCVFTTVRQSTLGTLNKPRRWRQRGYGKTKDLIGTKIVQHVHFKALYFLSRPLQNNNVKSPQFASSANRNRDGKLFQFPFGTQRFFNTLCWCWGVVP